MGSSSVQTGTVDVLRVAARHPQSHRGLSDAALTPSSLPFKEMEQFLWRRTRRRPRAAPYQRPLAAPVLDHAAQRSSNDTIDRGPPMEEHESRRSDECLSGNYCRFMVSWQASSAPPPLTAAASCQK